MKILAVSDVESGTIYSPAIRNRYGDVDLAISCGDLPYYYLEYIISMLDIPLYYVRGNHSGTIEQTVAGSRHSPWGAIDLHGRVIRDSRGILLAGVEGSIRYNLGPHQYTQNEMWLHAFRLVPSLLSNKLHYGRYLDILVTHAPPWKVHDMDDLPHHGIKAFNWLIKSFKPAFHLHGHIHVYRQDAVTISKVGQTMVVNTYNHRKIEINPPKDRWLYQKANRND